MEKHLRHMEQLGALEQRLEGLERLERLEGMSGLENLGQLKLLDRLDVDQINRLIDRLDRASSMDVEARQIFYLISAVVPGFVFKEAIRMNLADQQRLPSPVMLIIFYNVTNYLMLSLFLFGTDAFRYLQTHIFAGLLVWFFILLILPAILGYLTAKGLSSLKLKV